MKIVYALNSSAPGGVEQHVLDLVQGMTARGHEVDVVCPSGKMAKAYYDAGAKLVFDRPRIDIDPLYIFRLVRFLRKTKPDIFHAHQLKTVVNGLIAANLAGCKAKIAHIHTPLSQWQIPEIKKKINIFVNRLITNWGADAVLALTKATKEARIKGEGIDPERIVVIPNGIDLCNPQFVNRKPEDYRMKLNKEFGFPEGTTLVGTLSRLTVEKGIGTLIESIPTINPSTTLGAGYQPSTINNYHFVVAGTGELKDSLARQAKDLGVEGNITFLGFIPDDEKFTYLSSLDIFVFPSLAEGFGIALIEAMACGCACLVSDLPVLSEVGGDAVEVFKARDADDLAKKLSDLITLKERWEALGEAARARVEKEFTLEKFWERYEGLYKRLVEPPIESGEKFV